MKHFGWIAEEISEKEAKPDFSLQAETNRIENEKEIVDYQIKDQEESSKEAKNIGNTVEDEDLKWILDRISKRELHYCMSPVHREHLNLTKLLMQQRKEEDKNGNNQISVNAFFNYKALLHPHSISISETLCVHNVSELIQLQRP